MTVKIANNSINLLKNNKKNPKNINFSSQIKQIHGQANDHNKKNVSPDLCRAYCGVKNHTQDSPSFGAQSIDIVEILQFIKKTFGNELYGIKNIGKKETGILEDLIKSEDIFKNYAAVSVINEKGTKKDLKLLKVERFDNLLVKPNAKITDYNNKLIKTELIEAYMKHGGKEHYPIVKTYYFIKNNESQAGYSFAQNLMHIYKNNEIIKAFLQDSELTTKRARYAIYSNNFTIQNELLDKVNNLFKPEEAANIVEEVLKQNKYIKNINKVQYNITLKIAKEILEKNNTHKSTKLKDIYFPKPKPEPPYKEKLLKTKSDGININDYYDDLFSNERIKYLCTDIGKFGGFKHFKKLKDAMILYKKKNKNKNVEDQLLKIVKSVLYGRNNKMKTLKSSEKKEFIKENNALIKIFNEVQEGTNLKKYKPQNYPYKGYDDYINILNKYNEHS